MRLIITIIVVSCCLGGAVHAQVARLGLVAGHALTTEPSRVRLIVGQPVAGDVEGSVGARFGFLPLASKYPVSVDERASDAVQVFPNPARDHVRVLHRDVRFSSWTLIDRIGRVVASGEISEAAFFTDVSTATLPTGSYTIRCTGPGAARTWMIVVAR